MRPITAVLIGAMAAWLLTPATAAARTASVKCETKVSTYSWYPLPLKTISRIVEARVLQKLTRSGRLTLHPPGAAGKAPDLNLKITARIIEDAQQFSVFVSAQPLKKEQAGSMASVATRPINQRNHKAIQVAIEQAADEAGRKMEDLVTPFVDLMSEEGDSGKFVPLDIETGGDVSWSMGLRLGKALGKFKGNLGSLTARAGKEASARMSLAHCAVGADKPGMQTRCIDALAQLSRRHPSAQRAIIAVLFSAPPKKRSNEWEAVRRRAFRVTTSFSGPALQEAIQAWLFMLASDHSDNYHLFGGRREDYLIMETVATYLARNPQVPNLDRALAWCARPAKKDNKPPDSYCLKVMKSIPVTRRLALLYPQLAAPPSYSHREPWRAWTAMLETVIDRGKPLHPAVEKLCKRRVMRSFWKVDRKDCVEALGKQGRPTTQLLRFLIGVFISQDKEITFRVRDALKDIVKRNPKLCPRLKKTLGRFVGRGAFPMYYPRDYEVDVLKSCK